MPPNGRQERSVPRPPESASSNRAMVFYRLIMEVSRGRRLPACPPRKGPIFRRETNSWEPSRFSIRKGVPRFPTPLEGFLYRPKDPARSELKTIWLPSGDHTGEELSCDASNVNRCVVPRSKSRIQISPPPFRLSWRCTESRFPSGDKYNPLYLAWLPD